MTYQRQVLKERRKGAGGVYLLVRFRVCLGGAARSKAQTHAPCTVHCACVLYLGTAALSVEPRLSSHSALAGLRKLKRT